MPVTKIVLIVCILILSSGACAGQSGSCTGSTSIAGFHLKVEQQKGIQSISLEKVNGLHKGERLRYEPAKPGPGENTKAMIDVILTPSPGKDPAPLTVLDARSAGKTAEWVLPFDVSVVGVVFGPHGLDVKKIQSLVTRNSELIAQLADYAEQTATVGALVQTLALWERSSSGTGGLNAVLSGFSSRYNVALPKLNTDARPDEQAGQLLRAVLPSLTSYDPLSSSPGATIQQSAGLAATMASLFLGAPVTLAVGGTALFQNLKTLMFPDTDFQSAFVQPAQDGRMTLCSKPQNLKSRTRTAYLWALRVPASGPPSLSLPANVHLPLGWKSTLRLISHDASQAKLLQRVQGWQVASIDGREIHPANVTVTDAPGGAIQLDLTQASLAPGEYHLAGKWDWSTFAVAGAMQIHQFSDMEQARIEPASEDGLIEGSGEVTIRLAGSDFRFVDKVLLFKDAKADAPVAKLPMVLHEGKESDNPGFLETQVDTSKFTRGSYSLRIMQLNGKTHDVPFTVLPPNPLLRDVPIRVNLGQSRQSLLLRGTGLARVEKISGEGMTWILSPAESTGESGIADEMKATLTLDASAVKGSRLDIILSVRGLHQPLRMSRAIEVVGPRPAILSADRSFPPQMSVELRSNEIPSGFPVSFALRAVNLETSPVLELACRKDESKPRVFPLHPGEVRDGAKLDFAGEGVLFLSLDPGNLGPTGCELSATVRSEPAGISDPIVLGRVVRVPQIERFELTDEKADSDKYVGILIGRDLQTIEKAGWDAHQGFPVLGIPTPAVGQPERQTLKVALPWPSPTPKAPIFIWLRGESEGRSTRNAKPLP